MIVSHPLDMYVHLAVYMYYGIWLHVLRNPAVHVYIHVDLYVYSIYIIKLIYFFVYMYTYFTNRIHVPQYCVVHVYHMYSICFIFQLSTFKSI